MATSASYFLNAPSLGSATAVFTDANLAVCAADGFYSDGFIVREQVNCVLLPQQVCPACPFPPTPCGSTISASGSQGVFLIDIEAGANTGAVIVRFNPVGVPDGIRATLGANVFNKLTSPVDGFHQTSNAGAFTYVGATADDCGISGSTYLLQEFVYNGTIFVSTGSGQDVIVAAGDVSLGASAPGNMMMVIPKTVASPSIINFEVVGPCSETDWNMSVACPVLLTGFSSSVVGASSEAVCALAETVTHFNASLANTPGIVGLNDFVFSDAFGSTQLATGFYYADGSIVGGNEWFEVSADGIVIAIGVCVVPPVESYNCVSGTCVDPGDGTGTFATLGACEAACSASTVVSVFGFMEPCGAATIDDHMGAAVALDSPVNVDTMFVVDVFYVDAGGTCAGTQFTETFNVSILAGNDVSNFDACTQGTFFPSGATVCSACITAVDNPSVDISSFGCL